MDEPFATSPVSRKMRQGNYDFHSFCPLLSYNNCSHFSGSMHIYVDNVNNSVYNLRDRA